MANENPFQSIAAPNMRQAGMWDLRMMSAANRMETPFERGSRGMYRHQGMGDPMIGGLAGMSNEPDYSQFTFNPQAHEAAQRALSPYGLSPLEANQVKQNVLLPNNGFFGSHPRLSAALEGGIFGALASHGGETTGESIQGALEGIVGGNRIRQGLQRQQFARPFEAAGMMEQLNDMHQKRDLQDAEIQHYRALNQKLGRPDHAFTTHPISKVDPGYVTTDSETGQTKYEKNPDFDPALVARQASGSDFEREVLSRNEERAKQGLPPLNSRERMSLHGQWQAAGVAPRENARQPYENLKDARSTHEQWIKGLQGKMLKADDPAHQQQALQSLILERMNSGNFEIPSRSDIQSYINKQNKDIQTQIDTSNAEFETSYPQATTLPPEGKPSSPKRGQTAGQGTQANPIVIK